MMPTIRLESPSSSTDTTSSSPGEPLCEAAPRGGDATTSIPGVDVDRRSVVTQNGTLPSCDASLVDDETTMGAAGRVASREFALHGPIIDSYIDQTGRDTPSIVPALISSRHRFRPGTRPQVCPGCALRMSHRSWIPVSSLPCRPGSKRCPDDNTSLNSDRPGPGPDGTRRRAPGSIRCSLPWAMTNPSRSPNIGTGASRR